MRLFILILGILTVSAVPCGFCANVKRSGRTTPGKTTATAKSPTNSTNSPNIANSSNAVDTESPENSYEKVYAYRNEHLMKAKALTTAGRYDESLREWDSVCSIDPSAICLVAKALTLFHMKRYKESVVYYDRYLTLEDNPLRREPAIKDRARAEERRRAQLPLWRKAWFWLATLGGAAVVAGVVAGTVVGTRPPGPEQIEFRF